MTKRRRDQFERQTVVDTQTVAALTGATGGSLGIVQTLVEQELGDEREQNRKHPRRPTEVRREQRRLHTTFSVGNKDAVERIRNLADQWNMYTNNGSPDISGVVEYLLLPRLEAAEQGEIEPPDQPMRSSNNGKRSGEMWF